MVPWIRGEIYWSIHWLHWIRYLFHSAQPKKKNKIHVTSMAGWSWIAFASSDVPSRHDKRSRARCVQEAGIPEASCSTEHVHLQEPGNRWWRYHPHYIHYSTRTSNDHYFFDLQWNRIKTPHTCIPSRIRSLAFGFHWKMPPLKMAACGLSQGRTKLDCTDGELSIRWSSNLRPKLYFSRYEY